MGSTLNPKWNTIRVETKPQHDVLRTIGENNKVDGPRDEVILYLSMTLFHNGAHRS